MAPEQKNNPSPPPEEPESPEHEHRDPEEYVPSGDDEDTDIPSDEEASEDEPETESEDEEDVIDEDDDDEYAWVEATDSYLDLLDIFRDEGFLKKMSPDDFVDFVNSHSKGSGRQLAAVLATNGGLAHFEIEESE